MGLDGPMEKESIRRLRVLVADGPGVRLDEVTRTVAGLGHDEKTVPHNVAFVALGTGLLWFGWFGFNAGSALAANGVAAQAFVNTDIAGSIAMCTWLAISWLRDGKPSLVGAFTGAVAGLACITPAAGYIPTWAAFVVGLLAGSECYVAVMLRERAK